MGTVTGDSPYGLLKFLVCLLIFLTLVSCQRPPETGRLDLLKKHADLQRDVGGFISSIQVDSITGTYPDVAIEQLSQGLTKVRLKFQFLDSICQDDWRITIRPSFSPEFHWAPHLTPTDANIIAQHVFRAPALIVSDKQKQLTVIPDLDLIRNKPALEWYMDLDARANKMILGVSHSKVTEHVLFERDSGMCYPPGLVEFGFYVMTDTDSVNIANPWRRPLAFLWELWGKPLFKQGEPKVGDLNAYAKHTYNWAFNTWGKNVWQEFKLNKKDVGAPVFIVNVTQSPNYPGDINEREFRSIWNQAWFSSLRSAQGLYRYAKRNNDPELLKKALLTKELALSFPQKDGLFPSVIGTAMETVEVKGKKVSRSKGWGTYYFGNSNRNPLEEWGAAENAPYHILDMSWTAYLMLTWYEELEKDERLKVYAQRYANKLITLQDEQGFFPAWLDPKSLQPVPYLIQSPETSMSVTFLLKMFNVSGDEKYLSAAVKAMNAVVDNVIPISRWEDFETYWSCSSVLDSLLGKKIERNNAFKQNTLSMFWTAEALHNLYVVTKDPKYLAKGQRVLDELLMYQATWQPPFIPINALGGFGVMNGDGEWSDSRQSLFAELILLYGKSLNNEEYSQRGLAALRASFVMMYCPENPETKEQWEKVYPFFNEKDFGFTMENYGHGGETNTEGLGIGEFTIYDWGNGAAAEAYNRILDHFGEEFLKGPQ